MRKEFGLFLLLLTVLASSCYYDKEDELYPNAPCDTTAAVTFGGSIEPIIQQRCATAGCHAAGSSVGPMTTYAEIRTYCVNSKFQDRVLVQKNMPPSGLSACDLGKIQRWIDAGYPNN